MRLSAAALLAAVSAGAGAYDGTLQAPSAPCAPVYGKRPAPPGSLRIIGEMFRLPRVWIAPETAEEEHVSGPYVPETSAVNPGGPHAYFDALSLRGECMVAYSLRDMSQLLAFMDSTSKTWDVTYDPAHDPDPRRQDAAKLLIPASTVSLPNNVRLPIPDPGTDSVLVTWDSWLGREFAFANTGISNYKHFQFASPAARIWTEVKADFDYAQHFPPAVAMLRVRYYGEKAQGEAGPNVTNENPLSPQASEFPILPEVWTRYWAYFKPAGNWFEFSMWMADETHGPVKVLDRLQIQPNYSLGATGWEKFWLEYNTSDHGLPVFPARTAYARNVVMLKGVADPTTLLERPVR